MEIKASLSKELFVVESDLCVLLSNALENALHACKELKDKNKAAAIEVTAYEKNGRTFIQIVNSCEERILFEKGIPISIREFVIFL